MNESGGHLTDEELIELIERLRMLSRNRISRCQEDVRIGNKYVVGEDLETGILTVDLFTDVFSRWTRKTVRRRRAFFLVDREGAVSVKLDDRHLLKDLRSQLILEELANL